MAFIVPFIPLIAAGIGAAVTGVELAKAPGELKAPVAPTVAATQTNQGAAEQASALAQAQALSKRRGLASTILTSPTGASAPTAGSTLSQTLG